MLRNRIGKSQKAAAFLLFVSLGFCSPAAGLDQRVGVALGEGEDTGFRVRLQAVQSLYNGLSREDAEELYGGIIAPYQPQGLPLPQWAALYNDALNAFGTLQEPLDDYPERLLGLIGQGTRPTILRDYALQHLLSHMQFKLEADARKGLLQKIEPLVRAAPETTLPGTYLLGIWQLAGKPGYPSSEAIGKSALEIAADSDAFVPNRISAIQVCGQLGYAPALPLALKIAADTELKTGLRASAIATIGNLSKASESDRKFLTRLKRWGNPRIQYAAESALKRLN